MRVPSVVWRGLSAVAGRARRAWRVGLPQVEGEVEARGLGARAEILRDEHGIPHIRAASLADASFGLGFAHAQDRLFQLELNRRVASGRLAELFGKVAADADRFLRRIGLRRAAEREAQELWPDERALLESYAAGINAGMEAMRLRPPPEFLLLGVRPEPWTVVDSLAFSRVMALSLGMNWSAEAVRARIVQKAGPELAAKLTMGYPEGLPLTVPPGGLAADASAELLRLWEEARPFFSTGGEGASNAWVVSGARTATGKPLLSNDPHLQLQVPSVWYEAHLTVPRWGAGQSQDDRGLDVYGATLPGGPGVVIGHNRRVAWGFTNSNADAQDLFIERFDSPLAERVQFQGRLEAVERVTEVIKVKGGESVIEEVLLTRHGPVVAREGSQGLSLRWAAHDPGHTIQAMLDMARARDARELREALRNWHVPSQNVVFADADGNIGYLMAGTVPVRRKGTGLTPVPGWSGEYEWVGTVPLEGLPQSFNPECGYVVTANNAVVGREHPYHISWDWMAGNRAARIEAMLRAKAIVGPDDYVEIQRDLFCAPGLRLAGLCRGLSPADPLEARALELLLAWDGRAAADSAGAAVYEEMIVALARRALEPTLGQELLAELMGAPQAPAAPGSMLAGRYVGVLLDAIEREDASILPESMRGRTDPWRPLLEGALADAVADLSRRLGPQPARWTWGAVHRLSLKHPLGEVPALGLLFDGPTLPIGGDSDTPFQTAVMPHRPFEVAWAPSWRQIADLDDLSRSVTVLPGGQSGHPASDHYLDQFPLWRDGHFHPHWLEPSQVEAHLEGRLVLRPAAQAQRG